MEVVVGAILLIGAFALGHDTADQKMAQTQAHLEHEMTVEVLEDGFVAKGCRYRLGGPVQRDLTLPYSNDGADSQSIGRNPISQ